MGCTTIDVADQFDYRHLLLRPGVGCAGSPCQTGLVCVVPCRQSFGRMGHLVTSGRWSGCRRHGTLGVARDSGSWHPRGDGANPHQRVENSSTHHLAQTAVGSVHDWYRRSVRRRGADHLHRGGTGLAYRPVAAGDSQRAQGAAGGRRGRGHGGGVRRAARSTGIGRRIAAVRTAPELIDSGRFGDRDRGGRALCHLWRRPRYFPCPAWSSPEAGRWPPMS